MNWTSDKPVFTEDCVLVTADLIAGFWEHRLWEIKWYSTDGSGYWMWCDHNGEEWDDINDLKADKYLILPKQE